MTADGTAANSLNFTFTAALFLFLAALVAVNGCSRGGQSGSDENIVARVGSKKLTMDDVRHAIDTTQGTLVQQLPGYISVWVTDELLYQEAQRENIEGSDRYKEQMEQTQKQLAIQNLLQQFVYADTSGINEDLIRAYFDQHSAEFVLREDMMKLNIVGFTTRESASDFAASVGEASGGDSWAAALTKAKSSPSGAQSIIALPTDQYFSQRTLFPPELWKVAASLNINEVSFPVKTNLGYFLLQLLSVIPQGKTADLDIVHDEVRSRLLIERRRQKYSEYLGTLRKRYDVEVLVNSVPMDDTSKVQHHE